MTDPRLKFDRKELRRLARQLIRNNEFVAAGWLTRVAKSAPADATPGEVYASRASFFCGVEWVLSMIDDMRKQGASKETVTALIRAISNEIKAYMQTSDQEAPDITTAGGEPPGRPH